MHKLLPEGLGTPLTEANSSFLSRLSEENSITLGTLLTEVIFPQLGLVKLINSLKRGSPRIFYPYVINGTTDLTAKIISALEILMSRKDIIYLTLLPLKGILATQNVFRPKKAWCSLCWEEWKTQNIPIYEALIWGMQAIKACPVHEQPLDSQCPRCNSELPILSPLARPGYCAKCGSWLGLTGRTRLHQKKLSHYDLWVLKNLGELISVLPVLKCSPLKETVYTAIASHIVEKYGSSASAYARYINVPRATVIRWKARIAQPSLDHILKICYLSQTPLITIVTQGHIGNIKHDVRKFDGQRLFATPGNPKQAFNRLKVKRALGKYLRDDTKKPLSVTATARKLGCTKKTLYKHFPDLCRHIAAKAASHRKKCREERLTQERLFIETTAEQLFLDGIYPSYDAIEQASDKKGLLRGNDERLFWKNKLKDLGLGNGV